jgi:DNA-binding SARP family transcriptional activator/pimeloyl-ACP methyl ester carboxylesterase
MDRSPGRPSLAFRFFGAPKILEGERDLQLALRRGLALLAYLALARAPAPRGHLIQLLWPDADEATGRTRLRRLVYNLEDKLGRELFDAAGDTLALRDGVAEVDLLAFTQAARRLVGNAAAPLPAAALDAWNAWVERASLPLLHGLSFESELFDDWLRQQRLDHEHLLSRVLVCLSDACAAQGDTAAAARAAEQLLQIDLYNEPAYVRLMRLHAAQGNAAGVEAVFMRCADALRAEFGIKPGLETEQAYLAIVLGLQRPPPTAGVAQAFRLRFAESGQGAVAYAALGSGPEALVFITGFLSHIEIAWEQPVIRHTLQALAERFTVVLFDRRGAGLSERLGAVASTDAVAADVLTILDHAGIGKAWLFGSTEGGAVALQLAARRPERVQGLLLYGTTARGSWAEDHPWALTHAAFERWLERLLADWGGPTSLETFAPSAQQDPALRAWWARLLRHAASPASMGQTLRGLRDVDERALLPRIVVPTLVMHRRGDRAVRFEAGADLARRVPGSRFLPLEGDDHFWWCGDTAALLDAVDAFTGRQ